MRLLLPLPLLSSICLAQEPTTAAIPRTPEPRAEDVASMDAILGALYDVISGPAGQKRDWDRMRSLFLPEARKVERFGNIAHAFSTYEARFKADDKDPFMRGINSIQLLDDGKRWWVVTIMWQGGYAKLKLGPEHLGGL